MADGSVKVRGYVAAALVCALAQGALAVGGGAILAAAIQFDPFETSLPALPAPLTGPPAEPPSDDPEQAYAAPRAERPVVRLAFDVAADLSSVTGTETVVFTPDLPVCELVFRLWPNKPDTAGAGNELVLTSAAVDGTAVTPSVEQAGAPTGATGTLAELPVEGCAAAGQQVTVELGFRLRLGDASPERVGWSADAQMAWFATAYPLLAWEQGVGWMRTPAVGLSGETAGSEAFRLESLQVTAETGLDVMGTGARTGPATASGDRTLHSFVAESVRDVAVVVGELDVVEADVAGTAVHVAVPSSGSVAAAGDWLAASQDALEVVSDYLGPYPYTDLWVSVVPDFPSGVEFPGAIFYGDVDPADFIELVPHETAHMWVYGLVGNEQGRDPWLDEGLTAFVEAHVMGAGDLVAAVPLEPGVEGYLGGSMSFWDGLDPTGDLYGSGVYLGGARAFSLARRAAGGEAFDEALRGYVAAQAHQLATPEDLEAAFVGAPQALDVLRDAGAFDGDP